jgi:amidohydrolase
MVRVVPTLDPTVLAAVESYLDEHESGLVAFRRQLHSAPETSGEELATTEAIEQRLRTAGLHPVRLGRGTGLVCDVGDGSGPMVAVRADIDALAMPDEKQVSYRSRNPGVAHACGHDVHTTVVLGAGLALHRTGLLKAAGGTVRLVFEPSEESVPGGAVDILAEGWFDGVAAVIGLHCDPKVDVGQVGLRVGALTSAADMVELSVHGAGGHTSRPELTVDLLRVVGLVLTETPRLVTERTGGALRLVFGAVAAGDAANVIPTRGTLRGTLRTPDRAAWADGPAVLEQALADVLGPTGASWQINHRRGVPPVVNDATTTGVLADCARAALGPDSVVDMPQSWGGDSFAWYADQVPGSYARLGVHAPGNSPRLDLHAGSFDVDEAAIGLGVRLLATGAVALLARHAG